MKLVEFEPNEQGFDGTVYFRLFERRIHLILETDDRAFANECAEQLNLLDEPVVDSLCAASIRYCNEFLEAIGEPLEEFSAARDVLRLIHPSALIIPKPNSTGNPVIHLELNCDWEIEHGMEWVVRNGRVLYVGAFNGEDPYGNFDTDVSWNYA